MICHMTLLLLALGLVLLTGGAELLVRGASRLARAVGLSPLIIGLTVVAYGTSAPEFAVNVKAGLSGQTDIALGNVIGSNMFNVLVVLGLAALIAPLAVSHQLVRLDVPVMIAVSALAWLLAADGAITRVEGLALLAGIILYTAFLLRQGRKTSPFPGEPAASEHKKTSPSAFKAFVSPVLFVLVGLALLVIGARCLVAGASDIARLLGVSELLIGLTIVAVGTSLPELATSVVAGIRGERDIAVGNVVGSNIFNILAVLGVAAVISGRVPVPAPALRLDFPLMVAAALACLPIFFTGARISRWEGALFLACYAAYIAYLILAASRHHALPAFTAVMLYLALPIATLGILLSLLHALRRKTSA